MTDGDVVITMTWVYCLVWSMSSPVVEWLASNDDNHCQTTLTVTRTRRTTDLTALHQAYVIVGQHNAKIINDRNHQDHSILLNITLQFNLDVFSGTLQLHCHKLSSVCRRLSSVSDTSVL